MHRTKAMVCAVLFALILVSRVSGQVPAPSRTATEPVLLDTNPTVQKRLAEAADYLVDERWEEAIEVISQVSAGYGATLIEVSPRRYLDVATYCQILFSRLPPPALSIYRAQTDSQARLLFEEGRQSRRSAPLKRVVETAFASSFGDDALWLLGEFAWETGDLPRARNYWERLVPLPAMPSAETAVVLHYPRGGDGTAGIPLATVRARLVLCSLCEGARLRAELELASFRELHPEAVGQLAGREGRLVDLLEAFVAEDQTMQVRPECPPWSTAGGAVDRNGFACGVPLTVSAKWSVPYPEFADSQFAKQSPVELTPHEPQYLPVTSDGKLFVSDGTQIAAYDLETGLPAWAGVGGSAVIYPPVNAADPTKTDFPIAGTPTYSLTVNEGRLCARLGIPTTLRAGSEFRVHSELVCLDVAAGEGKLLWRVAESALQEFTAGELQGSPPDRPAATIAFEGSPLCIGGKLYVAARRGHPRVEAYVACLEIETGRISWIRKICTSLSTADESRNWASHQLLTAWGDQLYYCTDLGAIAALSASDGHLLWVRTYESMRQHSVRFDSPLPEPWVVNAPRPVPAHPLGGLVAQGLLFVAPADSDRLLAVRAVDGILLWQRKLNDRIAHLIGCQEGRLFVSGQRLTCVNAYSGDVEWTFGFSDPSGYGFGRGLLGSNGPAGSGESHVYWPTREEIFVINPDRGWAVDRVPLTALHGGTGGNLLAGAGGFVIAGPKRLTALRRSGRNVRPDDLTSRTARGEDEDKQSD